MAFMFNPSLPGSYSLLFLARRIHHSLRLRIFVRFFLLELSCFPRRRQDNQRRARVGAPAVLPTKALDLFTQWGF